MSSQQPKNPLHGVTLKAILEDLISRRGFEDLALRIKVRCFSHEPSLASSLKFLRKTDWARAEVERLYLSDQRQLEKRRARNQERAAQRAFRAAQENGVESEEGEETPAADSPEPVSLDGAEK